MVKARSDGVTACGDSFSTITPSDTVDIDGGTPRGIRVGGGPGVVQAVNADDAIVAIAVAEVDYLPIDAKRINATDTTGGLTLIAL